LLVAYLASENGLSLHPFFFVTISLNPTISLS